MTPSPGTNLDQLQDVNMTLSIALGHAEISLQDLLELDEQSLVELDRLVDEPVEVRLNGKLFARGEVITAGDRFGIRLTEIAGQARD